MRQTIFALLMMTAPAFAGVEEGRDLMEAGQFVAAKDMLWPAARSGNADAEELIGVMYAMGWVSRATTCACLNGTCAAP